MKTEFYVSYSHFTSLVLDNLPMDDNGEIDWNETNKVVIAKAAEKFKEQFSQMSVKEIQEFIDIHDSRSVE